MKYALIMHTDPTEWDRAPDEDRDAVMRKHEALREELTNSRELLNGAGLVGPEESTVLRLSEAEVIESPGLVEAKETFMTAYYVVDCASRERALEIARGILDFHVTAIEVRPIHDSTGMG